MADQHVVKEGMLKKIGAHRKNWRQRFFKMKLMHSHLKFEYYTDSSSSAKCLGEFEVPFGRYSVLEPPQSPLSVPVVQLVTTGRVYMVTSDDETYFREWVWAIETAMSKLRERSQSTVQAVQPVRKTGVLNTKFGRKWKTRRCVLSEKVLSCHSVKRGKEQKAVTLAVDESLRMFKLNDPPHSFCIESLVAAKGNQRRRLLFQADTETNAQGWLDALSVAGCQLQEDNSTFYRTAIDTMGHLLPPEDDYWMDSEGDDSASDMVPQSLSSHSQSQSHVPHVRPGFVPNFDQFSRFQHLHEFFRPPDAVLSQCGAASASAPGTASASNKAAPVTISVSTSTASC